MKLRLEHLSADLFGLDEDIRAAISSGSLGGVPVPKSPTRFSGGTGPLSLRPMWASAPASEM